MPPPIPGVAGIEHIGLTVPDIDAASRFFADVLGGEALYDIGPFADPADWMATNLGGHARTSIRRMRVLRIADGPVLELIELTEPGPVAGGWHVAFQVADMDAALAAIKAHGCDIQSGPVEMTQGPSAGLTWLYFSAPWGQQLELVSGRVAAYAGVAKPVWRPRP